MGPTRARFAMPAIAAEPSPARFKLLTSVGSFADAIPTFKLAFDAVSALLAPI